MSCWVLQFYLHTSIALFEPSQSSYLKRSFASKLFSATTRQYARSNDAWSVCLAIWRMESGRGGREQKPNGACQLHQWTVFGF